MYYVRKQLLMIKEMVDKMLNKTEPNNRSFWKTSSIPQRVKEAEAIEKSAEALVALVKQAKPEEIR